MALTRCSIARIECRNPSSGAGKDALEGVVAHGTQTALFDAMQFVGDIRTLLHRGHTPEGYAPLELEAAARLWGAILDDALDDLELGAVVGALAVAGESSDELLGLYRAAQE